ERRLQARTIGSVCSETTTILPCTREQRSDPRARTRTCSTGGVARFLVCPWASAFSCALEPALSCALEPALSCARPGWRSWVKSLGCSRLSSAPRVLRRQFLFHEKEHVR
ncbi:unnamed protein product, partial [Ectocarpus sp. 8 AP-2014]